MPPRQGLQTSRRVVQRASRALSCAVVEQKGLLDRQVTFTVPERPTLLHYRFL